MSLKLDSIADNANIVKRAKFYAFIIPLIIYLLSPVVQFSDSSYTLLLTQSIVDHASLDLSRYNIKLTPSINPFGSEFKYLPYHFERYKDRVYYIYPIGNAVLAIPFVKAFNLFGISAVTREGGYDKLNEIKMQKLMAALLSAISAWLTFLVAKKYLNWIGSIVISLGTAFGTAIFSTAACGLWGHTWSLIIGATVLLVLVKLDQGETVDETIIGSLLAWSYFVRPTNALMILVCTIYLLMSRKVRATRLLLTGAFWLSCFFCYSWYTYDNLLPTYYRMSYFEIRSFFSGLAGITISPARGLLVYSPAFLITLYLSASQFRQLVRNRLFVVSATIVAANIAVISCFKYWWGGSCYGPRYLTDITPWLAFMTIVSVRQFLVTNGPKARYALAIISFALIGISIFNTFPGAFHGKYFNWYDDVVQSDRFHTELLWDWQRAPFLDLLSTSGNNRI